VAANQHGNQAAALACGERAAAIDATPDLTLAALNLVGAAHKSQGDLERAYQTYLPCLTRAEASGNTRYVTIVLNNLGTVAHDRGAYDEARERYQRSLDIKTELGDARGVATGLVNLGSLDKDIEAYPAARVRLADAVARFRNLGEPHTVSFALALLAETELALGDPAAATGSAREAAEIAVRLENGPVRAMVGQALGDIARARGELAAAASHYTEALASGPELFERTRLLDRLALALGGSDPTRSARLYAEAERVRGEHGFASPPADAHLFHSEGARPSPRSRRS
jgi:tetratricopeptide (TPR) repeat protein